MPSDQIDYQLIGDDLQGVIVTLDPEEAVVAEAGAMMYMQDGIRMMTSLDMTGRSGNKLMDRLFAAGKRVLTGDSFFVTIFVNDSTLRRDVAFASPFPGKIQPIDLTKWKGTIIAQKDAFLCGARGVDVSIAFAKRIGAGLFGGEGLFLVHLTGPGRVILQTLPFSRLADRIIAASPRAGGRRVGEGSVLGALGGLLDGDNR
jgi:uncharacterized protein (AIM24 family)